MTAENPVQNPAHEAKHGTEEEGGSSNLSKVNMDPTPGILIIEVLLYNTDLEMLRNSCGMAMPLWIKIWSVYIKQEQAVKTKELSSFHRSV